MNNLAWTYREQGKTVEAAALQEEVLKKRKRILGYKHPDIAPDHGQSRLDVVAREQI